MSHGHGGHGAEEHEKKEVQEYTALLRVLPENKTIDTIPIYQKIFFSMPTMSTLPFLIMFGMYGVKYYETFGASLAMIGLFTAVARSLDVMSDPVMSWITDSTPANGCGRRKPFMFVGAFFYSMLLWLLLNPPYASEYWLSVWYGVCFILFSLSATFTLIPYDALGPELSEDSDERTRLFWVANVFDGIGTLIAVGLPTAMQQISADVTTPNDYICKNEPSTVNHCLMGQSCNSFLYEGRDGAFIFNSTLELMMRPFNQDVIPEAMKRCIIFAQSGYNLAEQNLLGGIVTATNTAEITLANRAFCDCLATCNDACDIANKRTGFSYVGYVFGAWFLFAMFFCCFCVPERNRPASKVLSIVPSLRQAFGNKPFQTLIPAWSYDAIATASFIALGPYFIDVVVAPEYMTMEDHGIDCYRSSPSYDGGKWVGLAGQTTSGDFNWQCRSQNVFALCGGCALIAMIVSLPFWGCAVRAWGKYRTWLRWSLSMAITNVLFLTVSKGQVTWVAIVFFMNGIPLGAKFLSESVLADIIDYDQFITGTRREATYFMFRSFIPKLVMIPTTTLPVVLLEPFGYQKSVGGMPQPQEEGVGIYIKAVLSMGFVCAMLSYYTKHAYPIEKNEDMKKIKSGIALHNLGKAAEDPLKPKHHHGPWTGYYPLYKPPKNAPGAESTLFDILGHFDVEYLKKECFHDFMHNGQPKKKHELLKMDLKKCHHGVEKLLHLSRHQHWTGLFFVIVAAVATVISCTNLLEHPTWQFVPTFCVIGLGLALTFYGYLHLRMSAARRLEELYKNWDKYENSTEYSAKRTFQQAVKIQAEKEKQYAMATSTFNKTKHHLSEGVSHFEPDRSAAKEWYHVGHEWKQYGEAAERELAAKIQLDEAKHYTSKAAKEYEHVFEHEHQKGHHHSMPEMIARILHHEDIIAQRLVYDEEEEHLQHHHSKTDWQKWETYMDTIEKYNPLYHPWSNIFFGCSREKRGTPLRTHDGRHDEFGLTAAQEHQLESGVTPTASGGGHGGGGHGH